MNRVHEQWPEGRHAEMVRLAGEHRPVREIARAIGVSRNSVIGRARRTGVKLNDHAPRDRSIKPRKARGGRDDAFRVAAVCATLCGESQAKAAKRLRCSPLSISGWRRDPEIMAKAEALAARVKARWAEIEAGKARMRAASEAAERTATARMNAPVLARMPERHRSMMEARCGGALLHEVGATHGVCRERVRQIEVQWRLEGLIVPGVRELNREAAERAQQRRRYRPRPVRVPAYVEAEATRLRTGGDPLSPYWRSKVEQALREFPIEATR